MKVCVATNGALRFSCVASFEATHFYFEQEVETKMKKWIALLLALVMCLSLCACGGGAKNESGETTDNELKEETKNQEIVLSKPIIVVDNDTVTISIVRFFTEYYNEGTKDEWARSGFEVDVENHLDGYTMDVFPRDVSLSDQRVIEFSTLRDAPVAGGKIKTFGFVRNDDKIFEDLNKLYELEGYFELTVSDGSYSYPELGGRVPFSIPDSMN